MTNKQYEHVGRAMLLAAALARGVEGLGDLRESLCKELTAVIGHDAAKTADKMIMSDPMPVWHLGDILNEITQAIERVDEGGAK